MGVDCMARFPVDCPAVYVSYFRFLSCIESLRLLLKDACIIVARYVNQLQDEKEEHWRLSSLKSYAQVPGRGSVDAFVVPEVHYPFADNDHSHGSISKV